MRIKGQFLVGAVSDEQTIPIRENRILIIPNDYKIETFDD